MIKTLEQWQGAKPLPFLGVLILGLLLWNIPAPEGLNLQAWHLFALFVSTIVAIIAKPLPMGALAIVALSISVFTHTLTLEQALSSFSEKVVWLVLCAFLLARGFIKTGLGTRIAYCFVYLMGKSTLGLGYGLALTELILAPFIPSNTARGGGVVFPIVSAIASEYKSSPVTQTENKLGAYLIKLCFQANIITSAMFLTAMAANSMIVRLAQDQGIDISWQDWATAAIVPGLCSLMLLPLILYKLFPPEIKKTPEAPQMAFKKLKEMGPLSFAEWMMLLTFVLLLVLWVFGKTLGINPTASAILGLAILLFTGVLTWDDILSEKNAWNAFVWLAILLMMSSMLNQLGMISWFSQLIQGSVQSFHWVTALVIISLVYFYSHYLFASMTAHVAAMYTAFLLVLIASGAPPLLAAMVLALLSSLWGGLTHYGTGTAPVYFGAQYVGIQQWWRLGLILSVVNLLVWTITGSIWWKFLALY